MRIKIHWTIGDSWEDELVVIGCNQEEAVAIARREIKARGLDIERNNVWSEVI